MPADRSTTLNLRQLQLFVMAAECGTMTAAAEELLLTQSGVSLGIANLENELGTQLFVRRRSLGLALTAAGTRLLPEAKRLLAHAEEVKLAAQSDGRELRGSLRIGCFRTAAPFILPGLIETFNAQHPFVAIDFVEAPSPELEEALLGGRCECALVYDLDMGSNVSCEPLFETAPYILLSVDHPLSRDDGPIALDELADEDLILLDVPPSGTHVLRVLAGCGVEPRIRYRVSSLELVRSLVGRNLGYALLISHPPGDLSYDGRALRARRISDPVTTTSFSVAWASGVRRTRRALAFADHCRAMLPVAISPSETVSSVARTGPADSGPERSERANRT